MKNKNLKSTKSETVTPNMKKLIQVNEKIDEYWGADIERIINEPVLSKKVLMTTGLIKKLFRPDPDLIPCKVDEIIYLDYLVFLNQIAFELFDRHYSLMAENKSKNKRG